MAWRQPKRSGKNPCCQRRGQCSCNRRANAVAARNPEAAPQPCTQICGVNKDKACGATKRGGVCPCRYC